MMRHEIHHAQTRHAMPMELEQIFAEQQRLLWHVSYRMTGSAADADDIVQETFARAWQSPPSADVPWRPWLLRVTTNLSLDLLRRRRHHAYTGSWLPSPVETTDRGMCGEIALPSTEARYEWLESLSFAFLLALEALTPRQRAVFDFSARATAELLSVSEENVRITHLRARRAIRSYDHHRCRPTSTLQEQTRHALAQFVRCLVTQDVDGAAALLTASVRTVTDGGGEYTALYRPLGGRHAVLTLHLRVAKRRGAGARISFRSIHGLPAVLIEYASAIKRQAPRVVMRCEVDADGRIRELQTILASRKLTAVRF